MFVIGSVFALLVAFSTQRSLLAQGYNAPNNSYTRATWSFSKGSCNGQRIRLSDNQFNGGQLDCRSPAFAGAASREASPETLKASC